MSSKILLIFFMGVFSSGWVLAQDAEKKAPITNEDELLDFDSIDKAEENPSAPPSAKEANKSKPAPLPQLKGEELPPPEPEAPPPPPPTARAPEAPPPELPPEAPKAPPPPAEEELPPPPPAQAEEAPALPENGTPPQTVGEEASGGEGLSRSDAAREQRFARIFKKFNQSEIGDDEWSKIAGDKAAESYNLQQGDTLWDISSKFFGNGFYWPKVWQLNASITNPHLIRAGNTLKFSPGSSTSPPSLDVDENAEMPLTENTGDLDTETVTTVNEGTDMQEHVTTDQILIPPPRKRTPMLKTLPPSFVDWKAPIGNYDSNGISTEVDKRYDFTNMKSSIPALISEAPWASGGRVVEMEGGTTTAASYQNIIVQIQGGARPGAVYTVFVNNGEVDDVITAQPLGTEVLTKANIEILEQVIGSPDTYRALVKFSILPVNIGDLVIAGDLITKSDFSNQGALSNVSARIMNGEVGKRSLLALHHSVFLNRGSQDGLQVGSLLNVIKNYQLRNRNSEVRYDSKPIGTLKVVRVDSHVATAIIVEESDMIMPGDETAITTQESGVDPKSGSVSDDGTPQMNEGSGPDTF